MSSLGLCLSGSSTELTAERTLALRNALAEAPEAAFIALAPCAVPLGLHAARHCGLRRDFGKACLAGQRGTWSGAT